MKSLFFFAIFFKKRNKISSFKINLPFEKLLKSVTIATQQDNI